MLRLFLSATSLFVLSASAMPQSPPFSTSSDGATIHTVNVGKGNFRFDPNETYAEPGDIITFNFYPTNHSVVRAAYGLPCIPYEDTGNNLTGFSSGNFPVNNLADPPQWNLTINDTQPIFYYCTAIGSCIQKGMVGVINPNASVSLDAQYQQALLSPYMLTPGEPFPDEQGNGASDVPTPALTANPSLITATPTGDATALAPGTAAAPTSGVSASHSGSKLSGGAIAGIVIAGVAFVALLAAVFWLLGHRRGMGSATAGQSMLGKGNRERTEAWAATSSNEPWGNASDPGARGGDMRQQGQGDGLMNQRAFSPDPHRSATASPIPSPGFMQQPMGSPTVLQGTSAYNSATNPGYFPMQQPPAELHSTEVTELEAPPALKYC